MKLKQSLFCICLGIVIGVLGMAIIGKVLSSHWQKKYNQDIGVLTEKLNNWKEAKEKGDAIIAQNNLDIAEEQKKRTESEAREKELLAKRVAMLAENAHLHAQLAMLPNDKLAIEMGNYIGQENVAVWMQGFTLTRIGGERTAGIFYDKTMYFSLAESRLGEITEYKFQIGSLKLSLDKSQKNFRLKEADANACADALTQSLKTNDDLRKVLRWKKIENFGKGFVAGGALVFILKVVKVI